MAQHHSAIYARPGNTKKVNMKRRPPANLAPKDILRKVPGRISVRVVLQEAMQKIMAQPTASVARRAELLVHGLPPNVKNAKRIHMQVMLARFRARSARKESLTSRRNQKFAILSLLDGT